MKVEKKLDAGPIIKQTKIKIKNTDDAGSIYKKIILKGKNLLIEAIKDLDTKLTNIEGQLPS